MNNEPLILRTGEFAYVDTFAGLIPCKVLSVRRVGEVGDRYIEVIVRYTATRGAYRRGEVSAHPAWRTCPRKAVFTRHGRQLIKPYTTEVDS